MKWIFRGFDAVGNKGWVYGDLTHDKRCVREEPYLVDRVMVGGYEVVPESVGLYTGLNDEDGNYIFENDIVEVRYSRPHSFETVCSKAVVGWSYGRFFLNTMLGDFIDLTRLCKVIGNVYENRNLISE